MGKDWRAVKLTEHVYWVGAVDWSLRDFHGYSTKRGSTYNAYLVLADKVTLIDTVKGPFKDELLGRIASVINPEDISYIVSNHSEMDHSGCLPQVVEAVKPEKIFVSTMGVKILAAHFHGLPNLVAVEDGQRVSLGDMSLTFIHTPMLHWPESMFSYLEQEDVLFSQDAFGMHLASDERFVDEVPPQLVHQEMAKYYANILLPYSSLVGKLLEKLGSWQLPEKIIATDHGPIWRRKEDIERLLQFYADWAAQRPTNKAVVVYDTMWGSTAKMADAIAAGLTEGGVGTRVMPLRQSHRSDVATELLEAGAIVVGSPTINNCMFPTVADVLTYLKGLRRRNLIGAAFGSYGWGGQAVEQVEDVLRAMKVELVAESVKVKFVPDASALQRCRELGRQVAAKLKEKLW